MLEGIVVGTYLLVAEGIDALCGRNREPEPARTHDTPGYPDHGTGVSVHAASGGLPGLGKRR